MSIENREGPRIVPTLALRVGRSSDSTQIADAVAQIWSEAEAALIPIIGREGVAALLRRSIFLSTSAYAWFSDLPNGDVKAINFGAVELLIANQPAEEAKRGGAALLLQFYELLTNLIGPSLAERILQSAWVDSSRGKSAQDHSL
ncbi:hypothetical protein [Caballeronia sp. SBC2]|uniref:hypothetical protein n=1 Tax=Caballeronia sp. SBC2 TaxID=2705547 RepID=UPI0013E0F536|nr:hypothetical protein [Caballeronia sp. SBC2]QIE29655.1 hypothetical protein SBC2_77310 [Caballeronia sp. SBC2]